MACSLLINLTDVPYVRRKDETNVWDERSLCPGQLNVGTERDLDPRGKQCDTEMSSKEKASKSQALRRNKLVSYPATLTCKTEEPRSASKARCKRKSAGLAAKLARQLKTSETRSPVIGDAGGLVSEWEKPR